MDIRDWRFDFLQLGSHTLELKIEAKVSMYFQGQSRVTETVPYALLQEWELISKSVRPYEVVRDEALSRDIARAVDVTVADSTLVPPGPRRNPVPTDRLYISARTTKPPVQICGELVLRSGVREWNVALFEMPRLGGAFYPGKWQETQPISGELPDHVDVIVRRADDVYLYFSVPETLDVMRVWGDEIVLKNVPVQKRGSQN